MGVNPVDQKFKVLSIHGFSNGEYFLMPAFISVIGSMSFWWRDVISEGKLNTITFTLFSGLILKIVRAISKEEISLSLDTRIATQGDINDDELGYYLAGLLEGDGHISIPASGNSTLNRVLNPRIIFTSHINNLPLYAYIQSKLNGAGRFQKVSDTVVRYIIGDIQSINLIVDLIHGKLRTPKNVTYNKLIEFMNNKSGRCIEQSKLDRSNLSSNSWLAGFTEADGNFYIKIIEAKDKSDTRKRSVSENISLVFRLDQRAYDKPTQSSMLPVMKEIAEFFSVDLKTYTTNSAHEVLSVSVTSLSKLSTVVNYFSTYSMLGIKHSDYLDWETVYKMFLSKEHLTETGREKIRLVKSGMNSKRII